MCKPKWLTFWWLWWRTCFHSILQFWDALFWWSAVLINQKNDSVERALKSKEILQNIRPKMIQRCYCCFVLLPLPDYNALPVVNTTVKRALCALNTVKGVSWQCTSISLSVQDTSHMLNTRGSQGSGGLQQIWTDVLSSHYYCVLLNPIFPLSWKRETERNKEGQRPFSIKTPILNLF